MSNISRILITAAAGLSLLACAKSTPDTTGQDAKTYLQLWIDRQDPNHTKFEYREADGLYLFKDKENPSPAGGEARDAEQYPYVHLRYTLSYLDGTISSTTEETVAKQLGTYGVSNYYGPEWLRLGEGYSYAGLDALLADMRTGGSRKAIIPAWMLTTARYSTQEEYLSACSTSSNLVYEVTFVGQCEDPEAEGVAEAAAYVAARYPGAESVAYWEEDAFPAGTFWLITDTSGFKEEDKLSSSASIKINYTGRRLDGTVFDTTVKRVAQDARIYNSSKSYGPQSVSLNEDYSEITMGSSSSLISGFKGALSLMHWHGQKAIAIFSSIHGYSSSGSGNTIPAYAPLIFELEILEEEKD